MRKQHFIALFIIAAIVLPIVGYAVMHLITYIIPMAEGNTVNQLLYTVILIALGLLVPYWMLKFGMDAAHLRNPHEKQLELKDLPKDKDDLKDSIFKN